MNSLRVVIVAFLLMSVSTPGHGQQTALRYKAPAEQVEYNVKITVDTPAETSTYQGRISYQGSTGGSDKLVLTFKGGLKESTKRKRSSRPAAPFGDPFGGGFGPGGPASPFGQPRGPGALRQTNAKITMTSTGEILSLEGDSQIPLPLGHLSLLVFETLPDEAKSNWTTTNGILLGKPRKPSNGFPGDPFARRAQPGKTSAGSETARFTMKGTSGSRVTIDKTYELDSPNTKPAFNVAGEGPLVFDLNQGLFVSANFSYKAKVKLENAELTIPLTVEYKLMTAEDIAIAQREAADAAAKAAEGAMAAAHAEFAGKSEKQIAELYRTGATVPPTGLTITPQMRLPKGLIIQNKWPFHNKWSPAKVVQELPDGKIEFEAVKKGKLYQRDRSTLSLAPDFVDQPHVGSAELAAFRRQLGGETSATPAVAEFRTWQDATGEFSVEAKYLAMDGDNVVLHRKKDDRQIKVPLKRLSPSDQEFISQQKDISGGNPFD